MRVLYCTDTYPPQMNGVSIVTALSVSGLARSGWECAVAAPRYPAAAHAAWNREGDAGEVFDFRARRADHAYGGGDRLLSTFASRRGRPGLTHRETSR